MNTPFRSHTSGLSAKLEHPFAQILAILLLGIAAYHNSFDVPLQFDDFTALRKTIDNRFRIGLEGGSRWVTDLTFSLNRLIHGERVFGFHLVNFLIHLSTALCLHGIARHALVALGLRRNGSPSTDTVRITSFLPFATAALFVCHPIQTQAITYIAQRYTSLATLFYLASMLCFIRSRLSMQSHHNATALRWALATLLCALLAMMSKEIAFTLPAMLILLELALFNGQLVRKPFFIAAMLVLFAVIPAQLAYLHGAEGGSLRQGLQHASAEVQSISRSDYLLTQLPVIATYLRLLILPINQNLDYDFPLYRSLAAPPVLLSLLMHALLIGCAFWLYRRTRLISDSQPSETIACQRLIFLGICWFYLGLMVESSIIPIRDVINEHRLYLPSGGFLLAVSAAVTLLLLRLPALRAAAWMLIVLICLLSASASHNRNQIWHNELAMWQDVLRKSPNKPRARFNAGFQLAKHMRHQEALPHLVRALELDPAPVLYWITLNGTVAMMPVAVGRADSGIQYQAMIDTVKPELMVPWRALSYNNLGLAYELLGNLYSAKANYILAASTNPALDLAWYNLALIAVRLNDRNGFEAARTRLLQLNPARVAQLSFPPSR